MMKRVFLNGKALLARCVIHENDRGLGSAEYGALDSVACDHYDAEMTRLGGVMAVLLVGAATAQAAETIHQFADSARVEAHKLSPDAQLVQIDVMSFSLVMDRSGLPDMSKVGPPAALVLYYVSPTTQRQTRVVARADLSDAQRQFLRERGIGPVQAEELRDPVTPYTLPIPEGFAELSQALAAAEQGGFQRDCAGVNPHYGCGRLVRAELHSASNGQGPGTPIWTFTFGQDAQARTITRQVDALTGRVVVVDEARPGVIAPASLSVRVVLSYSEGENAASVAALRDGQQAVVLLRARFHTRVVAPVSCLLFRSQLTGREGRQTDEQCEALKGTFAADDRPLTIIRPTTFHLGPGQNADVLEITWSLTANGTTQKAQESIRISR
jgi:hypothetical protein